MMHDKPLTVLLQRSQILVGLFLFCLACICQANTITVNTTADENGSGAACSLREAVYAATRKQAYGGCSAGEKYNTDTVQLPAGTFQLTGNGAASALVVDSDVIIRGASTFNWSQFDPVSGFKPGRVALSTTINVPANQRLFDTSASRAALRLYDIGINGGTAAYGGAIYAGGELTMENVQIQNAYASAAGGAVYLDGGKSWLSASHTVFYGNSSPVGDVLAMTCLDNLTLTSRTLTLDKVSVISSGSAASLATMDFCGTPTLNATSVTIGQNTLGSDPTAAALRLFHGNGHQLSNDSSVTFNGVTLVENTAGLYFNLPVRLNLSNSILAFNNGRDCTYQGYATDSSGNIALANDFIGGAPVEYSATTVNGYSTTCSLPQSSKNNNSTSGINLQYAVTTSNSVTTARTFADVLWPLSNYNGFTYGYLPRSGSPVIGGGTLNGACEKTDQREVYRPADIAGTAHCDIGALQYGTLLATDDSKDASNASYLTLDSEISSMSSSTSLTDLQQATLALYQQEKASFTYRSVFVDILTNDTPPELLDTTLANWRGLNSAAASTFPAIGVDNGYTIEAHPLGTFSASAAVTQANASASNLSCSWIAGLRELRIYRLDGSITPSGSVDVCQYSISYPGAGQKTALAYATVVNMAPLAEDDSISLTYGAQTTAAYNLLANDTDEGDGPSGTALYNANSGFWSDPSLPEARQVNIKIVTQPTQGTLKFDRSAPCPDNSANIDPQTCYGGNVVYTNTNTYSPFNDQFSYQVLDKNRQASNTATVSIKNTGNQVSNSSSKAGGTGIVFLLVLLGLGVIRFYLKRRASTRLSSRS